MEKNRNHRPGAAFAIAAADYLFLLERHYPQSSVLKLTGDRYKLNSLEHSVLYRGVAARDEARRRASKLAGPQSIAGNGLHIDGYNLLISLGSYLNGDFVFISNDSLLRDASEIHGKAFRSVLFDKAVLLLFSYLETLRPARVDFYFDKPVSQSGELCKKINQLLTHYGFEGRAITCQSPDYMLKTMDTGLIATSDSGIIDRCKIPVLNLAFGVLSFHYRKAFTDLRTLFSPIDPPNLVQYKM